jgi:peroxiredoxin
MNIRLIAILIIFIISISGCGGGSSGNSPGNSILDPVPPPSRNQDPPPPADPENSLDFSLFDTNGQLQTLNKHKGKVLLINFFASWCPSCVDEMGPLQRNIGERFKNSREVVVLGINMGEDIETVTNFAFNMGLTFPLALDPDRDVVVKMTDFISVPVYVIITQDQKMCYQDNGYRESTMISIIENLISKK